MNTKQKRNPTTKEKTKNKTRRTQIESHQRKISGSATAKELRYADQSNPFPTRDVRDWMRAEHSTINDSTEESKS